MVLSRALLLGLMSTACACGTTGNRAAATGAGGATATTSSASSAGTAGSGAMSSSHAVATGSGGAGGGSGGRGGSEAATYEFEVITTRHRAIPGKMFGGWGPHLGHLVRAPKPGGGSTLYWVDDVCSQPGGALPICDVLLDPTIGIFRRDGAGWTDLGVTALPGQVQQNTATVATGGTLRTYGVDVAGHVLVECTYDTVKAARACMALPFTLDPNSNYIGAALSPTGSKVVWWTVVKDGGGGAFDYVVDYGGGWNGPRAGGIGGYNDSSYINIDFKANSTAFTMHGQLVSGLAPNWTFLGAVGEGDLATTAPVTWANVLAPPAGDSIESTNDIFIDPITGDTHLLARATSGAAVYYFRAKGGAWSGPEYVLTGAYRARFSAWGGKLALVSSTAGTGLRYQIAPTIVAGHSVDWAASVTHAVPLPAGYDDIYAIYPEASVYQTSPVQGINVVVVGKLREWEALYVGVTLP